MTIVYGEFDQIDCRMESLAYYHKHRNDPHNDTRDERFYFGFRERLENDYIKDGLRVIDCVEKTFAWLRERGIKTALTAVFLSPGDRHSPPRRRLARRVD